MSVLLEREKSFYITSNITGITASDGSIVAQDGTVLSPDKSTIFLTYDSPGISLPPSAVDITFHIENASLWNTSPNISAELKNNKLDYLINNIQQPTITIPDGLYSVDTLTSTVSNVLVNRNQDSAGLVFTGDFATGRVILTTAINYQADFLTTFDNCRFILGFDRFLYPATPQANITNTQAPNEAKFNTNNSFTIRSDLCSNGIPVNGAGLNLMAIIPIPPDSIGQIINYTPFHPSVISCNFLRGKNTNSFYFTICNETGKSIKQTEPFTILLVLKYKLLLTSVDVPMMDV